MRIIQGGDVFGEKIQSFGMFILSIHTSGNINMHRVLLEDGVNICNVLVSFIERKWNRPNPWISSFMHVLINDVLYFWWCDCQRCQRTYLIIVIIVFVNRFLRHILGRNTWNSQWWSRFILIIINQCLWMDHFQKSTSPGHKMTSWKGIKQKEQL